MQEGYAGGQALSKAEGFELINAITSDEQVAMNVVWTGAF